MKKDLRHSWVLFLTLFGILLLFVVNAAISTNTRTIRIGTIAYGYVSSSSSSDPGRAPIRGTPAAAYNTSAPSMTTPDIKPIPLHCGNAVLDTDEECDLGIRLNGIRNCSTYCKILVCGDGIVSRQTGEECEPESFDVQTIDPVTGNTNTKKQYIHPLCGNYCLEPTCDADGVHCIGGCHWKFQNRCPAEIELLPITFFTKSSRASSSLRSSSLGTVQGVSVTKLTIALCGNGVIDPPEHCDQGDRNSDTEPNACRTDCTLPQCGDRVVDSLFGENCDEGAFNSNTEPNRCRLTCTPSLCGDDVVDASEECDSAINCSPECRRQLVQNTSTSQAMLLCPNGWLDPGEECDDGNSLNSDGCSSTCAREISVCGNGLLESHEECDDGQLNSDADPNHCRSDCKRSRCGDGTKDEKEQCDDGNLVNEDNCTNDCHTLVCGDGIVQQGEDCDDGNVLGLDGCSPMCTMERVSMHKKNYAFILFVVFVTMSMIGFLFGRRMGTKWNALRD